MRNALISKLINGVLKQANLLGLLEYPWLMLLKSRCLEVNLLLLLYQQSKLLDQSLLSYLLLGPFLASNLFLDISQMQYHGVNFSHLLLGFLFFNPQLLHFFLALLKTLFGASEHHVELRGLPDQF